MKFSAKQIAAVVQGSIEGDENAIVRQLAKIEEAEEGSLCFLANLKYEKYLYTTAASVVIINNDLKLKNTIASTLIRVPDAYQAFTVLLKTYEQLTQTSKNGVHETACIAKTARLGTNVYVGPYAVIDEFAEIGNNTQVYPHAYIGEHVIAGTDCIFYSGVHIYKYCQVGNHVILHSGTVVGSDGFGFAPNEKGLFDKIPQLGNVVIEDNVEIGANSCIDRATMGSTRIRKGVKLDNLIQVAHNVTVGENTVVAAQAGISGSTKVGKGVMIGGQAGIVGHIEIADHAKVNAQSGVSKSIETKGGAVTGSPAFEYAKSLRSQVIYRSLPELLHRIDELEKKVEELKNGH